MPLDDPGELFVEVDLHDKEIGFIERAVAHSNPQRIHRAVYVLVTNSRQQMLFQQRSAKKDLYPLMWALSCAGHVTGKMAYRETAEKELMEELHIKTDLYFVTNILVKTDTETEHCQIYMCRMDTAPTNFDKDEVEQVAWVDINAIPEFVKENPLPQADMQVLKLLLYIN